MRKKCIFILGKDLKRCAKSLNSTNISDADKLDLLRIMSKRGISQDDDGTVEFTRDPDGDASGNDGDASENDDASVSRLVSTPSRAEKRSAKKAHKERYAKTSRNAKKKSRSPSSTQIEATPSVEKPTSRRSPKKKKKLLRTNPTVVTDDANSESLLSASSDPTAVSVAYVLAADKLRRMPGGLTEEQKGAKAEMKDQYDKLFQRKFNSLPSDKEK